jgi:RHS repeat-associated protein
VSVRRRASGRAHYNYFRDYDPGTGRYAQSDPLGVRAGHSTYGYAGAMPVLAIDPKGLFHLVPVVSWSLVDDVPGTTFFNTPLGAVGAFVSVRCKCTLNCKSGGWELDDCSAFLYLDVVVRGDLSHQAETWTRAREAEHVLDFRNGIGPMTSAGVAAENSTKGVPFPSKLDCEESSNSLVKAAVLGVAREVGRLTRVRDTNGSHRYPGTWPYR